MPDIRAEDLIYFENQLYLPMLMKVVEKDVEQINKQPLKVKRPYLQIVESAIEMVQKDLKASEMYLLRNDMKVLNGELVVIQRHIFFNQVEWRITGSF